MKVWVLRRLRADARSWWAHRALRAAGETREAARRERASVRSALDVVRKALATRDAHVTIGLGVTTIHFGTGATLTSHEPVETMATAQVLIRLGLPHIDLRPVADPWTLFGLPMVAVGREADDGPWGPLSHAPLAVHAACAEALGARIGNVVPIDRAAPEGWAIVVP